jgi:hypothetical protein
VPAHEDAAAAAAGSSQNVEQPVSLADHLLDLYRQAFDRPAAALLKKQIVAAVASFPDRGLWEQAFADTAAAGGNSWKYALRIAERLHQEAAADHSPAIPDAPSPTPAPAPEESLWAETQAALRRQMTQATYDAIIRPARLANVEGQVWTLAAPAVAAEWLENRLSDKVQQAASAVAGYAVTLRFATVR